MHIRVDAGLSFKIPNTCKCLLNKSEQQLDTRQIVALSIICILINFANSDKVHAWSKNVDCMKIVIQDIYKKDKKLIEVLNSNPWQVYKTIPLCIFYLVPFILSHWSLWSIYHSFFPVNADI